MSAETTYVPGDATALIGPRCVLLLPGEATEAAGTVWRQLGQLFAVALEDRPAS